MATEPSTIDTHTTTTHTATKQWIVGVDGSEDGLAALRWAARFAADRNEQVAPLSAWHVPLPIAAMAGRRGGDVDRVGMRAEATVAGDHAVAAIEADADLRGVTLSPIVAEGHPAPLLMERAAADTVIVVGRRGISALKHRLLGSVSQYLATHAEGPVVIVPVDWSDRDCRKIVVGFDGSEHSIAALRWAIDLAPEQCEVTALAAIDVAPWLSAERTMELHADLVESATQRLTDAIDAVDPLRRATRSVVLHGPRQAFAEALTDADLVVVGPRGVGRLARAMLGSLTTWLLSDAPCPVAVVPSPDPADDLGAGTSAVDAQVDS